MSIVLPGATAAALAAVIYEVLHNFYAAPTVGKHAVITWAPPVVYAATAVLGVLRALVLRARRPEVYATIGLGADSVRAQPATSILADDRGSSVFTPGEER